MTTEEIAGIRPTAEQREVIAHPLEPLRVVAGAGAGKTATVTARIVAAVSNGVPPESVLGLTFTNKAAEELAARVRGALQDHARAGREAEITTYHGFARRLLQEFGAIVGVERDTPVIGPGYTRQLLGESLEQGVYLSLDLTAPWVHVNNAAVLARQLADHLATPEQLLQAAPATPDEVWQARSELAGIIARYRDLKRELGVVDFGDLMRTAHDLVTSHPEVANRIRLRYRLLVLDEYQDTDPGQRSLLQALFGSGFAVTAVGDEDQIIYEWRGASPANFAGFPHDFSDAHGDPAPSKPLTLNRRSGPQILDVANAIRSQIHADGNFDPLQPLPDAAPASVELHQFRTAEEEASWIAEEVRTRHDEGGVPWSEIAILFRKHRNIRVVRDAMEAQGVPLEVVSLGGLLDVPRVSDLHAWLRILDRPEDSAALARVLLGGRYRLGFGDLAPLARWVRTRTRSRDDDDAGPGWPLVEAVDRLDEAQGLSEEGRGRLREFAGLYRELLVDAQATSLAELCRRIIDATDAWAEVDALEPAARTSARLNLYRFLDLTEEWSPLKGRPSLAAFLGYLDLLAEERAAEELDTARVSGSEAVSLLTIHRAKGLEWDTVLLPAVAERTFPATGFAFDNPNVRASSLPHELRLDAGTLPALTGDRELDDEVLREHEMRQEWRAAYVAVTRAKRRLVMTTAWWYWGKRPVPPSPLYELAKAVPTSVEAGFVPEPGLPPKREPSWPGPAGDQDFPEGWQAALRATLADPDWPRRHPRASPAAYDEAVQQIELMLEGLPAPPQPAAQGPPDVSVTNLVALAQCPLRFRWTAIDPLPRRPSRSRRRGVEVHRRIELHNIGQAPFEEIHEDLYDAPESGPAEPEGDPFAAFIDSDYGTQRPRWTEAPIDLRLDAGRVRGRIDAVYERDDGSWEIVDFKSGRSNEDPARHVQLEAYGVAAFAGALDREPPEEMAVSFVYLGGGHAQVETTPIDAGWEAGARANLEMLLEGAHRDEYEPTPSVACHTCDFVAFCEQGRTYLERAASDPTR